MESASEQIEKFISELLTLGYPDEKLYRAHSTV